MANNGAKKGVSLELKSKEGLEQLKAISRSETVNIMAELGDVMKGEERAEHERYDVANLQRQVDEMQA